MKESPNNDDEHGEIGMSPLMDDKGCMSRARRKT